MESTQKSHIIGQLSRLLECYLRLLRSWPTPILDDLWRRAENPQLMHFVDQRSALQAKFGGRAFRAADHPTDYNKSRQNVSPAPEYLLGAPATVAARPGKHLADNRDRCEIRPGSPSP